MAFWADPLTEQFSIDADIRSNIPNDVTRFDAIFKRSAGGFFIAAIRLQSGAEAVYQMVQFHFAPN
jgi:hypothetical protein